MKAIIHTDGASSGNPGPAGIGIVIKTDNETFTISDYIGITTNNVAEYTALIKALETAKAKGIRSIDVFMDSELIVKQLKGEYKVKNQGLQPLYKKVKQLLKSFDRHTIKHVPRDSNKEADALSKQAIKRGREKLF